MGGSAILVPIHLDGLCVRKGRSVVSPTADFSRLPYFDRADNRDIHPRTPYVSESVIRHPFDGNDLYLDAGIHLHWALPPALTKASLWADPEKKVSVFPPVPDRWLVRQGRLGKTPVIQQQWVVESNYISADLPTDDTGLAAVTIPYPGDRLQPFRYLGRVLTLEAWRSQPYNPNNYLYGLTAVGYRQAATAYEDPSFAALYPNCRSVFGFFDNRNPGVMPRKGYFYEVLGWYSSPADDYLPGLWKRVLADQKQRGQEIPFDHNFPKILQKELAWVLPDEVTKDKVTGEYLLDEAAKQIMGSSTPQIVCYGRLTFDTPGKLEPQLQLETPMVTIANTVTEALSAHLARCVADSSHPDPGIESSGIPFDKTTIEDQLESVLLASQLEHRQVDIGAKFKEARHAKGFLPAGASMSWVVRPVESTQIPGSSEEDIQLWPDVAHLLNRLNQLQGGYNRAQAQIRSLCEQLYADWYRYMLCAYPPEDSRDDYLDADQVRFYIEREALPRLERERMLAGELVPAPDANSPTPLVAKAGSNTNSLAAQIQQALSGILQEIRKHNNGPPETQANGKQNDQTKPKAKVKQYVLQPIVAPAYWQPTEPVILLTGEASKVTDRFGRDDDWLDDQGVACRFYSWSETGGIAENLKEICDYAASKEAFGARIWDGPPWHPFLLEWKVEIRPFKNFSNQQSAEQVYNPAFIKRNFSLKADAVDLVPRSQDPLLAQGAFTYQGYSILTPHVVDHYRAHLKAYLERLDQEEAERNNSGAQPPSPMQIETIRRLRAGLAQLDQHKAICLAQSLGGFNNALLMQQKTIQLSIDDPLGFAEDQAFAQRVRDALGEMVHRAPQPWNDFCPIRAGELRLLRLCLVDSFGQRVEVPCHTCCSSETLPLGHSGDRASVMLPPRLVQPAQLSFRWLAATEDGKEMNAHPETTPICGWVMANHLDGNLFVYKNSGEALGYLEVEAGAVVRWRSAPGLESSIIFMDQIDNGYLRRLVEFFLRGSATYFQTFLKDLENAQKTIVPESTNQHPELAFLMGQPLALVRASLSLELQGYPAIDQGWDALLQDLTRKQRETDGFTQVWFPIRLGEPGQLNDGLTVYWKETPDGYEDDAYYIPYYEQAGEITTGSNQPKCDFLYQSIAAPPIKIAMLMDPRGVVHATSGILPTKAISIPPYHYADALKRIEMSFLVAPWLTDRVKERKEMILPAPSESGFTWTWLQKRGRIWQPPLSVNSGNLYATFAAESQICEGWLKLSHTSDAESKSKSNSNAGDGEHSG